MFNRAMTRTIFVRSGNGRVLQEMLRCEAQAFV